MVCSQYDDVRLHKNMKVLQFMSSSADSEYFSNLGKGLHKKGIDVLYGTLFKTGSETPEWISQLSDVSYFCVGAASKYDFPRSVVRLASVLRQIRPDIIQTHLYEASLVGLLAAKMAGVPCRILTRHHTDQAHLIGKRLPIAVDRWEARAAHRIVVLSKAVRDFLVSHDHADPKKITVIYQGFDFDKFSAAQEEGDRVRTEFGFSKDDFVVGTFASFFPTKGHRFLIEAAKKLVDNIPTLKLFFVGEGGDKEALRVQISRSGLDEKVVVFAGFRRDVSACMKACDAVVHPSLSEAFCQVLIESMSTGVPLISTDVGGAREVIVRDETGLLIAPASIEEIVEAVMKIYSDASFAGKIAAGAKQSVRERFTVERMISEQIECYKSLVENRVNGVGRTV